MQVISAESTQLFTGPPEAPLQVVRVTIEAAPEPVTVRVDGDGLHGTATGRGVVEVPVAVQRPVTGQRRTARASAGEHSVAFDVVVAEPGWTMYMVGHFHYDPVWWNTQGAYTSTWTENPPGRCRQTHAFDLVRMHLDKALAEPEYAFVLAEVDYLKPFWDTHPESRADVCRLMAEGRVEIMGGTYNEPSSNLVNPETTIRTFVHGMGFQRDVLGGDPASAWQLDVFGHDPQFPGMAADAGLTSSAWARGPHHQWGPTHNECGVDGMQFCSEFEWVAPSGRGLLTHYMPAHYAAGWWMDDAASLADAEQAVYRLFLDLKKVALTRNVLLPVGTDYTPPNRWVVDIARDWASRYTWPRFVCAVPSQFFAAVRAELDERGSGPSAQTRDMNPIYTGCHVSYIDTKLANRAAEHAVLAAEKFAVFAAQAAGIAYPAAALAKAWVQLVYGAHHDAITGSESDQVYLDLLTGWRDAWELGRTVRDRSLAVLSSAVDAGEALVVWNPLTHSRTDVVTVHLDAPATGVVDADGNAVPAVVADGGHTLTWLARDVPSLGWRAYRTSSSGAAGWESLPGNTIGNDYLRLTVDPDRGGGVSSLIHHGSELIAAGRIGNELAVYEEYAAHPREGEGPWHLVPNGTVRRSSSTPARISVEHSPVGQRITVRGHIANVLRYSQTLTLWNGVDRLDCRIRIDDFGDSDQLIRLRWPCPIPGAMPVSEVGDAVVGRGFALLDDGTGSVDSARHPWTLDNAAYGWFGLSSALRVVDGHGMRAVSVAEVVVADEAASGAARDLLVALVRAGVTATCSGAERPRYGFLGTDSNLPDVRIVVGGPTHNAFAKTVLADADPVYSAEVDRQLAETGRVAVWIPAARSLSEEWVPGADLRDVSALPVLLIAGRDDDGLAAALACVVADLADAELQVMQDAPTGLRPGDLRTVALLNRGTPSFAVGHDGTMSIALMRSCTGWPSRAWIDDPRQTAPDGSSFQLQHWSHSFDYALVAGAGDWRDASIPDRSAAFSEPLSAVPRPDGPGGLPDTGSLLQVDGARLAALKPAGNPLARNSIEVMDPARVALRLVEECGQESVVTVRSTLGSVSHLRPADLLEAPMPDGRERASVHLTGYQIGTELARIEIPRLAASPGLTLGPEAEPSQPLAARYWLHNRGPAPLGGLPVVAHFDQQQVHAVQSAQLHLSVASDCTDALVAGTVTLICPPGWVAEPARQVFSLPAGDHATIPVALTIATSAEPGVYPVRAQLRAEGDDLPPSWRQVVEDVCLVTVGDEAADGPLIRFTDEPADVDLSVGSSARLSVTVASEARADMVLEAHLISPWGTWEWMGPASQGATVPASGTTTVEFDVAPPVWVTPGQWWALIRIGCAGSLLYSRAARVTVRC